MAKKQGEQNQKRMVVTMRHVTTPDAEQRLSRAIDILLRVAARGTTKSKDGINTEKETPPTRGSTGDTPTGGAEESNSYESG